VRALDGDHHMVDRRVVAQLLVTYLSLQRRTGQLLGFGSARAKDALAVTANVLSMAPRDREAVGLDDDVEGMSDGPSGRVVVSAVKTVGGLLSGLWRGGSSGVGGGGGDGGGGGGEGTGAGGGADGDGSLGAAFVQFLMAETAEEREGGADGESAPGGGARAT
jgi:hypothetical protein